MQVVTGENFQTLIETGKVPEYVPPKADDKTDVKPEAKTEIVARDDAGKFVSVEPGKEAVDKPEETSDNSDTAKAVPDDGAEADDDDLPEKVRRKIGAKHRQMKEAEEFGEREFARRKAAERRAEELEQENARLKTKSGPESKAADEPKPDDFKTVAEYADALVEYKLNKRMAERDADTESQRQKAAQAEAQKGLNARIAQARKDFPDYAEVVAEADLEVPSHMAQFFLESELGPQVGYTLIKNRAEFDRIAKLSPIRALVELGKLETKLAKPEVAKPETKQEAAPISKAPSPITPLDSSGATKVETDPSKMNLKELREYERRRSAEARRH